MAITTNTALEKLRRGQLIVGMIVQTLRTVDIVKIAQGCDHDWLFIDMEHGPLSFESVHEICVAALDTGVTPVVRVPGHEHFHASRVLDCGAMGIVVPHVHTEEQARHVVDSCKFPPIGHRSLMGAYRQLGFQSMPLAEATKLMNENMLLVVMIESPIAVENVEKIAAVEGIDVIHIGTSDLLAEMGITGQYAHKDIEAIYERVIAACRANGKFAGLGGIRDPKLIAKYLRMGCRLVTHSDVQYLVRAATDWARMLRAIDLD